MRRGAALSGHRRIKAASAPGNRWHGEHTQDRGGSHHRDAHAHAWTGSSGRASRVHEGWRSYQRNDCRNPVQRFGLGLVSGNGRGLDRSAGCTCRVEVDLLLCGIAVKQSLNANNSLSTGAQQPDGNRVQAGCSPACWGGGGEANAAESLRIPPAISARAATRATLGVVIPLAEAPAEWKVRGPQHFAIAGGVAVGINLISLAAANELFEPCDLLCTATVIPDQSPIEYRVPSGKSCAQQIVKTEPLYEMSKVDVKRRADQDETMPTLPMPAHTLERPRSQQMGGDSRGEVPSRDIERAAVAAGKQDRNQPSLQRVSRAHPTAAAHDIQRQSHQRSRQATPAEGSP